MRKIGIVFLFILIMSSCAQLFFAEPQPRKGVVVKSFIDEIQGAYSDSLLNIIIGEKEFEVSGEKYLLTNKTPNAQEVLLKYYNDFYFASFLDSSYYSVFMAKFYDEKLAIYMLNADAVSRSRISRVVDIEVLDSITEMYLINPSKKEFDKLIEYDLFEVIDVLEKQK